MLFKIISALLMNVFCLKTHKIRSTSRINNLYYYKSQLDENTDEALNVLGAFKYQQSLLVFPKLILM